MNILFTVTSALRFPRSGLPNSYGGRSNIRNASKSRITLCTHKRMLLSEPPDPKSRSYEQYSAAINIAQTSFEQNRLQHARKWARFRLYIHCAEFWQTVYAHTHTIWIDISGVHTPLRKLASTDRSPLHHPRSTPEALHLSCVPHTLYWQYIVIF